MTTATWSFIEWGQTHCRHTVDQNGCEHTPRTVGQVLVYIDCNRICTIAQKVAHQDGHIYKLSHTTTRITNTHTNTHKNRTKKACRHAHMNKTSPNSVADSGLPAVEVRNTDI